MKRRMPMKNKTGDTMQRSNAIAGANGMKRYQPIDSPIRIMPTATIPPLNRIPREKNPLCIFEDIGEIPFNQRMGVRERLWDQNRTIGCPGRRTGLLRHACCISSGACTVFRPRSCPLHRMPCLLCSNRCRAWISHTCRSRSTAFLVLSSHHPLSNPYHV